MKSPRNGRRVCPGTEFTERSGSSNRKRRQADFIGKWVRWNGSINNVSRGGTTVKIDMGEGSWASDIVLAVSPASREKATGLSKDTYITFVGRMNDQPGSLTAMELQEVTIE